LATYFRLPIQDFWNEQYGRESSYSYRQFVFSKIKKVANQEELRSSRGIILKNIENLIAIHNYMTYTLSANESEFITRIFRYLRDWKKLVYFIQQFDAEDRDKYEVSVIVKRRVNSDDKKKTELKSTLPPPLDMKFFKM